MSTSSKTIISVSKEVYDVTGNHYISLSFFPGLTPLQIIENEFPRSHSDVFQLVEITTELEPSTIRIGGGYTKTYRPIYGSRNVKVLQSWKWVGCQYMKLPEIANA